MSKARLLIGSDDVGLREVPILKERGLAAASAELGYSGDTIRRIHDEELDLRIVPLDTVVAEMESMTRPGIRRLDGVGLMSCRPYGSGKGLEALRSRIRSLSDLHRSFPHIPARHAPIVISDLKHTLAGRPLSDLSPDPWTAIVPPGKGISAADLSAGLAALPQRTIEAWYSACRKWRADLVEDLEFGGLIVSRGADGNLRPRVALRRASMGGRMHLSEFDPKVAFAAGLPIFLVDLDIEREPFTAFHELCTESFTHYARKDRSKGEIVLHRFLDQNPQLLRSEYYKEFLTETCFAIRNGRRLSMRTDLMLRPISVSSSKFLIAELKRPDIAAYRMEGERVRLTRAVMRAISQVLSYRERLLDPANEAEVRRRLEQPPPKDYELAVVIGLRAKGESPETAASVRGLAQIHGVRLIRFDELAEFGMKLIGPESAIVTP